MTKLAKSLACGVGHDPSQSTSLQESLEVQCRYSSIKNNPWANQTRICKRMVVSTFVFLYLDRAATSLPSPASLWLESRIPWLAWKEITTSKSVEKDCKKLKQHSRSWDEEKKMQTCMTFCCGIFSITLARHLQGSVSPVWDISTYLKH